MNSLYIRNVLLFMGENKMDYYKTKKYQILITIIIMWSLTVPNINGNVISNNKIISVEIGINEAIKIANSHILRQQKQNYFISGISEIKDDYKKTTLFYIITLNPIGFIVVTNNINLPPIMSYSFSNEFGEINQDNILLEILKTDVMVRLKYIDKLSIDIVEKRHNLWEEYISGANIFDQSNLMTTIGPL